MPEIAVTKSSFRKTIKSPILLCTLLAIMLSEQSSVLADDIHPENNRPTDAKTLEIVRKAIKAEDSGKLDEAIKLHQSVVERDPKNVQSMNAIAGLYGTQKNFGAEVKWAKKAIEINPKFVLGYINYGTALAASGKTSQARAAYEKARQLDPNYALTYYQMGSLEEGMHNLDKALAEYRKSVELDPKFLEGHFSLAATYANLKQFDKAKLELKKVLEIQPGAEDAKEMLKHIETDAAHVR